MAPPATVAADADSELAPDARKAQLRAVGYDEGAAMLSPAPAAQGDKAPDAAQEEEKAKAARIRASWEASLGRFLGGKLFDLLKEHVSQAGLEGYAKDGIGAIGDAIPGLVKPTKAGAAGGILDEAGEAQALQTFLGALTPILTGAAEKWVEGADGQKVLGAISGWVEGHPRTVAVSLGAAAIAAAIAAYLSDMDIPTLEHTFKLGGGASVDLSTELGSLQAIAVQAASAAVKWQGEGAKASIGASWKEGGGVSATVDAGIERELGGDAKVNANGSVSLAQDGRLTAKLDGGLKGKVRGTPLEVGAGLSHGQGGDADAATRVNGKVVLGDGGQQTALTGSWDPGSDQFEFGVDQKVVQELEGGGKVSYANHVGTDGGKMNLAWSKNDVSAQLDLAMKEGMNTLGASAAWKNEEGAQASGSATVDLDSGRLTALGAKLGWQDPDAFKGFMVEYQRKWMNDQGVDSHHLAATLEYAIGKLEARVSGGVDLQGGQLTRSRADVLMGYGLSPDWKMLGGASYERNLNGQTGGMDSQLEARLGLQYKNVAFTAGYRPESKAWTVGLTIPLGRK
ncbi:MAG: hypothetical protein H6744_18250 [Deltaproteobacteria bacterium]|nr:hypothetical protein [Deltaproteobacteria bacterium]